MKQTVRHISSLSIALVMIFSLVGPAHAATYNYAVEGGNLKFDPTTGTITDCDSSVYSANIPSEIYGVPVTTIGKSAFIDCKKMASISIPSSVTKIEGNAFSRCSQLTEISIPDSVTTLAKSANGMFSGCSKLEKITISGSVKYIPNLYASAAKEIILGEGVEEIGYEAFRNCTSLESITLPDSVKTIQSKSFENCKSLTTVTFGSGVKNIDDNAFYFFGTPKIESFYFRGNAPSIGKKIINKFADGFTIYYPEGASGWTTPSWNGFITKPYTLSGGTSTQGKPATTSTPAITQPVNNLVTAVPSYSPVYVNGTQVKFDAYNIDKNNYFKLRDLAFILSGTKAQFNVEWKNAVAMTSGQPYTPVGGEMAAGSGINQIAKPTSSAVLLDSSPVSLTAYNINGNNYFKLRDIASLFDFVVRWDSTLQGVVIQTDEPYTDV